MDDDSGVVLIQVVGGHEAELVLIAHKVLFRLVNVIQLLSESFTVGIQEIKLVQIEQVLFYLMSPTSIKYPLWFTSTHQRSMLLQVTNVQNICNCLQQLQHRSMGIIVIVSKHINMIPSLFMMIVNCDL